MPFDPANPLTPDDLWQWWLTRAQPRFPLQPNPPANGASAAGADGIDDWLVPGQTPNQADNSGIAPASTASDGYPNDWIHPNTWNPPQAISPSPARPPTNTVSSPVGLGFSNGLPPTDPFAAHWSTIPASRLTAVAFAPPIFPDASGRFQLTLPAPAPSHFPFSGEGGLLGGIPKMLAAQAAAGAPADEPAAPSQVSSPASTAALPWFGDSTEDSIADVAKSTGVGVGQGVIGLAGLPGDARELAARGLQKAADRLAPGSAPVAAEALSRLVPALTPLMPWLPALLQAPTSSQLQQAAESVTGPFYQPKTSAGEYARTIGEYAPAALAPGGGFLSSLLRFAVLPGLASETAGQLTKGSAAEPWIRALAGLAAAGPSAFLHLRPSRAAAETAETLSGHNPAPLATEVAENIGGQLPSEAVTARAETVAPATEQSAGAPTASASAAASPAAIGDGQAAAEATTNADRVGPPQVKLNKAAGDAWAFYATDNILSEDQFSIQPEITIKSNGPSSLKTRADAVGRNRTTGEIAISEMKASSTAPLTPNQRVVYPELETHGGTVVGKGKAPYVGGTQIPPTRVAIIRKP
jgi:hypothetical protein